MAKKRAKKVKQIKQVKQARKQKILLGKYNRAGFVLICISVILLLFNGIYYAIARNLIAQRFIEGVQEAKEMIEATIVFPFTMAQIAGFLLTLGIIWIVLAILLWITMCQIEITKRKTQKWFLLVVAIITLLSGLISPLVIISGVLAIIASIIYLRKK